uniref:Kruppel-1-like zinc finger transcription factor n=1 Tax=Phenacoccus solenopsis TaxID=483260 RepID=A0A7U3T2S6_9HEMI|nr:Kruppel-1-like zinc finger transcription factor [Phenacoccus solenopsis]
MKMAKIDETAQKQWIKNLWMNCKPEVKQNESLWSRVSEMVSAFNGELQMQRDNRRMKPDSVPVGVDCTLSPVLPNNTLNIVARSEFCATPISATAASTESSVKTVVCSPDIPVYPLTAQPAEEVTVDSSTTQTQSAQGILQKIYQCTICSEGFNQKVSLTAHLKTHTKESEDPYQCNFCGKTFAVPARLTRHYRTHTGEKPYQCEYCNKSFSVKENLSVHKRIHTKERPYKCDVCDRAFEHSGKLHRHMRIHTGERPHKCTFCSKTFIQSGQLVIHLRTHTGEKPYVCKSCNKGFTCSKQLKVHTRTHTGEKPYTCDICGKSFGYNHVLKLHQVAHFGVKEYKCTICKQTFTSKKAMETHIKMVHSDSNAARNGTEGESSCASSTSDKENKMEMATEMPFPRSPVPPSLVSSAPSIERVRDADLHMVTAPSTYENCNFLQTGTTTVSIVQGSSPAESNNLKDFCTYYPRLPTHNQGGLNSALLAAAAAATEELITNYKNDNPLPHPSKFQIPAAGAQYYPIASPSSYSDSSRSSPSPKLEVNEAVDETALYIIPDFNQELASESRFQDPNTMNAASSSSVIINVPFQDGLTPPSSSSTSPVPSSPDIVDLPAARDELTLPPRKRSKMILKSMEKAKVEDTNFRYNSVIHYAKASPIT